MNYIIHLLIYLFIYIIVSLSLNMVVGYGGYLTLAHASYFAVGSYAYAIASLKLGWGFLPSLILGVIISTLLSFAISIPTWRLKGDSFVLISLAIQALIFSILNNWVSPFAEPGTWKNLTNGPSGLSGIPKPVIFGIKLDTNGYILILSFIVASICFTIAWFLLKSPWGRVLQAMRDDELATRGLGKNVKIIKMQVFAIACGMAAISGSLYAAYVRYVDPSTGSIDHSILMLCMVIVGGLGNFRGPFVGAIVLLAIPELLRYIPKLLQYLSVFINIPDTTAAEIRLMVYGLLLILIIHLRPQGIAGTYRIE